MFIDRQDAGQQLAEQLSHLRGAPDVVVVGLPRGGVPVAAELDAVSTLETDGFESLQAWTTRCFSPRSKTKR